MEDFRVDVIVGKGPGATAIPLEIAAVHPGRRHHPGRPAAGAAARPVRLHRAHGLLRARRAGARARRSARLLDVELDRRGAPRSPAGRAARPGSPTGCCAGSATTPRCTRRRRGHREIARAGAGAVRGRRPRARPARPGGAATRCCAASAAARSACPRWRWRWGRSPRPSRRSPSRSWCGRGCWPAPRAAGSPPRRPGQHLGPDAAPGRVPDRPRCSTW